MRSEHKTRLCPIGAADQLHAFLGSNGAWSLLSIAERIFFPPGSIIIAACQKPTGILIHRGGSIQMNSSSYVAGSIGTESSGPVRIFGLVESLSNNEYRYSIQAITEAEFDVISKNAFDDFMLARPELLQKLNDALSTLYRGAICRMKDSTGKILKT